MAIISVTALKHFGMKKKEHDLIRAAIATKKSKGSVTLTDEQIEIIEKISGQRYESTWLGTNNDDNSPIDIDENGKYVILSAES